MGGLRRFSRIASPKILLGGTVASGDILLESVPCRSGHRRILRWNQK